MRTETIGRPQRRLTPRGQTKNAVREHFNFQSPAGRTAVLALALLVGAAIVIPVAYWRAAFAGVWAATIAWTICILSGLLALWLIQRFNGPDKVVKQVLSGTLVRMSLPLAAVLVVHLYGGTLAEAGFVYYILAFYLITLAVETMLTAGPQSKPPTESQTG